jgi:hypothetical protein
MTSLAIADILKLLDPNGRNHRITRKYETIGGSRVLEAGYQSIERVNVDKSKLPSERVKDMPIIGEEVYIPTFERKDFDVPESKVTEMVKLLGFPEDPEKYPEDIRRNTLKETILFLFDSYERTKLFLGLHDSCKEFNTLLSPSGERNLESFKLSFKNKSQYHMSINLLFTNGRLITYQKTDDYIYCENRFDSEGRLYYHISDDISFGDTGGKGEEYILIDLPLPFYILKKYYQEIKSEDEGFFTFNEKFYMYYDILDCRLKEEINSTTISHDLYIKLMEYIRNQRKLMAQQLQHVINQKVPEIISVVAGYL